MATRDYWFEIEWDGLNGWEAMAGQHPTLKMAQDALERLQRDTYENLRIVRVAPLYDVEVVS